MKTKLSALFAITALTHLGLAPLAWAQSDPRANRGLVGKIYVAESKGSTQIMANGRIYAGEQSASYPAPGTIIETKAESHGAFVYSNGTGMFVDQNTRVEIGLFTQEPFPSARPSTAGPGSAPVSQSSVHLVRGGVAICVGETVAGSSMVYTTPEALITIRQGKVVIRSSNQKTTVDLLEGDVTVRLGEQDPGGQILRPGDRATVGAGPDGKTRVITLSPSPSETVRALDDSAVVACNARKTVSFSAIARNGNQAAGGGADDSDPAAGAGQEIVANPAVPLNPPSNITVSPDRLPGGTP
jgi:hypothetical protein